LPSRREAAPTGTHQGPSPWTLTHAYISVSKYQWPLETLYFHVFKVQELGLWWVPVGAASRRDGDALALLGHGFSQTVVGIIRSDTPHDQ